MNKYIVGLGLVMAALFCSGSSVGQTQATLYTECNTLYSKIRDGAIDRRKALEEMKLLIPRVKEFYHRNSKVEFGADRWVFPVQGYGASAIGGKNGNGYIASGYNFFDGNKHGGHPAHDIFIRDKNQDSYDDLTGKAVNVVSVSGGVVVALEMNWDTTSTQRGGKYIWIYEPVSNSLFYYAHNNQVFVHGGEIVKPGDVIATVGRTGFNAFKRRSPTHLHLMQLQVTDGGYPKPVNCYELLKSRKS